MSAENFVEHENYHEVLKEQNGNIRRKPKKQK